MIADSKAHLRGPVARLAWVAGALGLSVACAPYTPEIEAPTFSLPGAHAALTCEQCHGPPPFSAFTWDTNCVSCHEEDRKDTGHYPGQGCAGDGDGCHHDTDLSWADALGGVNHDFLPLDGVHAVACSLCHSTDPPTADAIVPPEGTSALCWSCHEEDRLVPATYGVLHYVEDPLVLAPDSETRWDCKACHDTQARVGAPVAGWEVPPDREHEGIRFPHATQTAGFALPIDSWVVACTDCHPNAPPVYTCTTNCHAAIFVEPRITQHNGLDPIVNDTTCSVDGCHPHADIRQQ